MNRRRFVATVGALGAAQVFTQRVGAISFVRFPYLQNLRSDGVSILWSTFEPGDSAVQLFDGGRFFPVVSARSRALPPADTRLPATIYQHQADVSGLLPSSAYGYLIFMNGQDVTPNGRFLFRTPSVGPFQFLVFGDSGQATDAQVRIATALGNEDPNFVLHVGDLAYGQGTFEQFHQNHFNYYFGLMARSPFFTAPGNHDYETQNAAPYLTLHAPPAGGVPSADRGRYYSFDWGNVHFVAIDSNLSLERSAAGTGPMLRWLENDLLATRKFWRVAFFHHPPYAAGPNELDPLSKLARERISPVLERHGVQLVLNGHEHSYQRSHPIRNGARVDGGPATLYVTTGGGGALLYPVFRSNLVANNQSVHHYLKIDVNGLQMRIRALGADGQAFDSVTLSPPPIIQGDATVKGVTFIPSLRDGALVRIVGRDLAAEERHICASPLPTELSGTLVTINDRLLNLFYVSNTQIYGQVPFAVSGNATLRVITANGFAESTVTSG